MPFLSNILIIVLNLYISNTSTSRLGRDCLKITGNPIKIYTKKNIITIIGNKNNIRIKLKIISNNLLKYFLYINYRYLFNIFFIELISELIFFKGLYGLIGNIMLVLPSNTAFINLFLG